MKLLISLSSEAFKRIVHEYGAKVRGLGSPADKFVPYLVTDGAYKKVSVVAYLKSDLKDRTSDVVKLEYVNHAVSNIKQFNRRIELNSWLRANKDLDFEAVVKKLNSV